MNRSEWLANQRGYLIDAKTQVVHELQKGGFAIQRRQVLSVLARRIKVSGKQKWVIHIRGFCEQFLIAVDTQFDLPRAFNLASWKITVEYMEGGAVKMAKYPQATAYLREAQNQGRIVRVPGHSFKATLAKEPLIDEECKRIVQEVVDSHEETAGCYDEWKLSSDCKPPLDKKGLNEGQRLQMEPMINPAERMRKAGLHPPAMLTMMTMLGALKKPRINNKLIVHQGLEYEDRFDTPLANRSPGQVPNVAGIGITSKRQLPVMTQLLMQKAHELGKAFMQTLKYAEKVEVIKQMKEQPRCVYADTVLSAYLLQSMFPQIHIDKNLFLGDATTMSWLSGDFFRVVYRLTDYMSETAGIRDRIAELLGRGSHLSDKKGWDHRVSMLLKAFGLTSLSSTTEFDNFFLAMGAEVFASVVCPIMGIANDIGVLIYNLLASGIPLTLLLNTKCHDATTDSFTVHAQYHKGTERDDLPEFDLKELEALNCNIKVGDDYLGVWNRYAPYLDAFIDKIWGCKTEGTTSPSKLFEICQHDLDFVNMTIRKNVRRTVGRLAAGVTNVETLVESCKSAALLANQAIVCEIAREVADRIKHRVGMTLGGSDHYNADVRAGAGVFDPQAVEELYKPDHSFVKKLFMERRCARNYGMCLELLKMVLKQK